MVTSWLELEPDIGDKPDYLMIFSRCESKQDCRKLCSRVHISYGKRLFSTCACALAKRSQKTRMMGEHHPSEQGRYLLNVGAVHFY